MFLSGILIGISVSNVGWVLSDVVKLHSNRQALVVSMDKCGRFIWTKNLEIRTADIYYQDLPSTKDKHRGTKRIHLLLGISPLT